MSEIRKTMKNKFGEIIGEASMCWVETPKSEFDSTRAVALVEKCMDVVHQEIGMGVTRYSQIMSENAKLKEENENLKKIIAKELSENDEFGMEYTGILLLKDEIKKLKEANKILRDAVESDIYCLDVFAGKPVWYGFKIAFRDASGMQRDKAREALASADKIMGDEK